MKIKRMLLICTIVFTLLVSITACGSNTDNDSDLGFVNEEAAEEQAIIQAATDQQATVETVIPTPDPKLDVENLIGSWVDINSPDCFANITKTDSGYQYEDQDGKYAATFKDGVLKVTVSDADTADVYFDPETKHMFLIYQDSQSEFSKK